MPSPLTWLFPPCKQCAQLLGAVNDLRTQLAGITDRLTNMETRIMSAISDATARITNSVQTEIAAVLAALAASPPDVAAAVTQLNALSDKLDAETAALQPPAPTA